MKPLARRKACDRTGIRLSSGNARERAQVQPHGLEIHIRPQSAQALLVEVYPRGEEAALQGEKNYTSVEELLAVDARNNPDDGVIK